jgi:hypothetical protein
MSLPKIQYPIYEAKILSREKPIKFRPFLVKEQKLLMMAVESKSMDTVVDSIKQIINNCALEELDVDSLSMVDVELFFLNLRGRSVGETIDVFFKCKNLVEDQECGMVIDVNVDILKDVTVKNVGISNKIMFTDKIGVMMKYPTLEFLKIVESEENVSNKMIAMCIDKIFDDDEVYDPKDATPEEVDEFLTNIKEDVYEKLQNFIKNAPTIHYSNQHICTKCGFEHTVKLEGLNDFFT